MKKFKHLVVTAVVLCMAALPAFAAPTGRVNWISGYIEAEGQAVVPARKKNTPAGKLLARRGAMVDLQRNMLETLEGVQVDGRTVMKDFEASDRVRTEVHGIVRGIEVTGVKMAGDVCIIHGRVPIVNVRKVAATAKHGSKKPSGKAPAKRPAKKGNLTGVVIDARHLPVVPAMEFRILNENGKVVYSVDQVPYERFLQSGLCQYYNNINYAKGQLMLGSRFITVKAKTLSQDRVDIVLRNSDAARLAGKQPFKKSCSVAVILGD